MDKQYLREKLEAMRQNFVESTHHERAVGVLDEAHMSKKIEHKDCSRVDQKIQEQKEIFESCCKKD